MIHNERTFHKILAERNRRRLRAGGQPLKQPQRQYVSPVVEGIAQHEQEQRQRMEQANQQQQAPPIDLFGENNIQEPQEPDEEEYEPPALYNDPDVQDELEAQGELQQIDDTSRFGVPGTSSDSGYVPETPVPPLLPPPPPNPQTVVEPEAEAEEVTLNPDDIDMSNDTVVEG